jgi:hypothetical protein
MNSLIIRMNLSLNLSNINLYIRRYNYSYSNNTSTHVIKPLKNPINKKDTPCIGGMFSQDNHCPYCKGEKISVCLSCYGSGKEYLGAMKETMCINCNGHGCNTCIYCGGSGVNHIM